MPQAAGGAHRHSRRCCRVKQCALWYCCLVSGVVLVWVGGGHLLPPSLSSPIRHEVCTRPFVCMVGACMPSNRHRLPSRRTSTPPSPRRTNAQVRDVEEGDPPVRRRVVGGVSHAISRALPRGKHRHACRPDPASYAMLCWDCGSALCGVNGIGAPKTSVEYSIYSIEWEGVRPTNTSRQCVLVPEEVVDGREGVQLQG